MTQIILENGITLLMNGAQNRSFEVSVVIKTGHINEPKLGLASLYENVVIKQSQRAKRNIVSSYGGDITAFTTGGSITALKKTMLELWDACCNPHLTELEVSEAAQDILQHTIDLANVPERQTKMAYKHTAFAQDDVVWDTAEYIRRVSGLTVEDVQDYITSNYVGSNLIISYCGPEDSFDKLTDLCRQLFGKLPTGKRTQIKKLLYTGGFEKITGDNDTMLLAAFGWDISKLSDFAETNVLMSLLSARLERQLTPLGIGCNLKIAGYYGFRTLRILLTTNLPQPCSEELLVRSKKDMVTAIDLVCGNIHRVTHDCASDRRMETSRQRAMTQRLAISNEKLFRTVETAWLHLKRGVVYDNDRCIDKIWQLDAVNVRNMAVKIFAQKLTLVTYGIEGVDYEDVIEKMK
ncbi:MAG: insulinase family protein [Alphaproteobacteria bacterium]|nr:insulinase family protein [Alphaproteobacteria bacterium]